MSKSAYPIDPSLTAIAVAYKNRNYVADLVAPRIPVASQEFTWLRYSDKAYFKIFETDVGRRSAPNEVSLEAFEETGTVKDSAGAFTGDFFKEGWGFIFVPSSLRRSPNPP